MRVAQLALSTLLSTVVRGLTPWVLGVPRAELVEHRRFRVDGAAVMVCQVWLDRVWDATLADREGVDMAKKSKKSKKDKKGKKK